MSQQPHLHPHHLQNHNHHDYDYEFDYDYDYTSTIPDECLAIIFQSLCSADRNRCSLVSRRWFAVEGQSRYRADFNSNSGIIPFLPSMLTRFDSIQKLSLKSERKSSSVDDEALGLIARRCSRLASLKLRGCRDVTEVGMAALGRNCKNLKKFSCGGCVFGAKGLNGLLGNCSTIQELCVKRLKGFEGKEEIGIGLACESLRVVCLKDLYNGQCFAPLLIGSRNLKSLRVTRCAGKWDSVLRDVCVGNLSLTEIRLEKLQVSDYGLEGISRCSNLDILHLMKVVECTDYGLKMIAKRCKLIRKLHIDGWRTNRIGDEGLIAFAKNGGNLLELVMVGLNPSIAGLAYISLCCTKLERLAICGSDTVGDRELECLAIKRPNLNKLCIKGCQLLTNSGIISFATLCPNLVKMKVRKCKRVTGDVARFLRVTKPQLEVILDVNKVEEEGVDARSIDGEIELPAGDEGSPAMESVSAGAGLWSGLRLRIGLLGGYLVTSTLRRWSNGDGSPIGSP